MVEYYNHDDSYITVGKLYSKTNLI